MIIKMCFIKGNKTSLTTFINWFFYSIKKLVSATLLSATRCPIEKAERLRKRFNRIKIRKVIIKDVYYDCQKDRPR
jgi:hypothetical protein